MTKPTDVLHYLDIGALGLLIRNRSVSSREVTQALLDRIAALDGDLHAYALVLADAARAQADAADSEIAAGGWRGPLHGVPIAVKDLFDIEGVPTRAGMRLRSQPVATRDATVVRRLRDAGAVLVGKPELTEGAYSDHHPAVVPPRNPWHADYWPGISSSGSGVAVAAGMAYGSLASDTGGSIRWPSAANGLTGLKPTWGRVSRYGAAELAASLDHVGTMARSAIDAGILLGAIAGADPDDPTASPMPVPDATAGAGIAGWRIGVDAAWNRDGVDAGTRAVLAGALATFAALGAEIVDVRFPDVAQTVADWVPQCAVEAAVAHRDRYPRMQADYGAVLAAVIETGKALSGTDYQAILLRRAAFRGRVDRVLAAVDVLLTPVQPFAPLTLAQIRTLGTQPDLIAGLQRYTCPFNMSGHPTLTLPGGCTDDGMPIGLQLVAPRWREDALVRAGAAFQARTSWHRRHPER
ncbi:amidase [Massilia sp. CT11-137]|uniref:amidase n=1 Tax=Massilia sp. CT11-137 TaxID=3393901 RepID=UPI0039B0EAB6